MTKTELIEKVGKKAFFADEYSLAAKLNYESGISSFDKFLNGKTLKQNNAVIHLIKYPKGFVIKIAKLFSSIPFGVAYSEIKRIVLIRNQEISNLIFELNNNQKISFSIKTSHVSEVRQFLDGFHLIYEDNETKNKERNREQKEQKQNRQEKQSFNNGNFNDILVENAFKVLGVNRDSSKEDIKGAYRELAKKYNTDQRNTYEEHVRKMLEDKMKEINSAKDFLQKNGLM